MPRTELRSEVEIEAPPSHVYRVLTDFPRYAEWNPFLTSLSLGASGKLEPGQQLQLELSLPEGRTYVLEPELTHVTENAELRWRGRFMHPSLLQLDQLFLLTERRAGVTRLVQGLDFSGYLLRFSGNALTLSARGAVYMNQALKKRAESTR